MYNPAVKNDKPRRARQDRKREQLSTNIVEPRRRATKQAHFEVSSKSAMSSRTVGSSGRPGDMVFGAAELLCLERMTSWMARATTERLVASRGMPRTASDLPACQRRGKTASLNWEVPLTEQVFRGPVKRIQRGLQVLSAPCSPCWSSTRSKNVPG